MSPRRPPARHRVPHAAVIVALAALALGACSSGGTSSSSTTTTTAAAGSTTTAAPSTSTTATTATTGASTTAAPTTAATTSVASTTAGPTTTIMPALPSDPGLYADQLVVAWGRGKRDLALVYGLPSVVQQLFDHADPGGNHWRRTGEDGAAGTIYVTYHDDAGGGTLTLGYSDVVGSDPTSNHHQLIVSARFG